MRNIKFVLFSPREDGCISFAGNLRENPAVFAYIVKKKQKGNIKIFKI